jgi:hypothetical protein
MLRFGERGVLTTGDGKMKKDDLITCLEKMKACFDQVAPNYVEALDEAIAYANQTPRAEVTCSDGVMPLHDEILALLKKRMKMKYEYINPNFLTAITMALSDYYECEDNDIDDWIQDMYGA